jgi:hypothetical protein
MKGWKLRLGRSEGGIVARLVQLGEIDWPRKPLEDEDR